VARVAARELLDGAEPADAHARMFYGALQAGSEPAIES
jgi:hypothetical protein